jgi:hypothetical protein
MRDGKQAIEIWDGKISVTITSRAVIAVIAPPPTAVCTPHQNELGS